jgi:hypothetical protein
VKKAGPPCRPVLSNRPLPKSQRILDIAARLPITRLPDWAISVSAFSCLLSFVNAAQLKARSSAGEHFPDTEGVGGSIPPVPTSSFRVSVSADFVAARGSLMLPGESRSRSVAMQAAYRV